MNDFNCNSKKSFVIVFYCTACLNRPKGDLPYMKSFAHSILTAKRLRQTLLTATLFAGMSCSSVLAAANPYADAPVGDWSYDAIEQLIQENIISGYDAAAFQKEKTATRYEMARFLANGLSKYDQATSEQRALLDRLADSYKTELDILGITRDASGTYGMKEAAPPPAPGQKKPTLPKIRVGGETLVEAMNVDNGRTHKNTNNWRQRIHLDADVNDRVFYHARIQGQGKFGSNANQSDAEKFRFHQNYFGIKNFLGIERLHVGRLNLAAGREMALAYQGNADGVWMRHTFGKGRAEAFFVDIARETATDTAVELRGLNLNYAPTDKFEANAMWFASDKTGITSEAANYADIGFSAELDKGLTLVGEYARSSADGHPQAWAAQLTYNWKSAKRQRGFYTYEGMVNVKQAHDQAIGISYRDIEPNALPGGGNYYGFGDAVTRNHKGFMIGYQNMVMEGIRLSLNYQHLLPHTGLGQAANRYYAAFDLYY